MRVFFAIEFKDEIKNYLDSIQSDLKKYCTKGNFSRKENLHLTLRFIGEVDLNTLDTLKSVLDKVALCNSPFTLKLNNLGSFNKGNRHILWTGIQKEDNSLNLLYDSLQSILSENGFEKETRKYSPHITLCREALIDKDYFEEIKNIKLEPHPIEVNKISLMESTRVDGKLIYRPIHVKELTWRY